MKINQILLTIILLTLIPLWATAQEDLEPDAETIESWSALGNSVLMVLIAVITPILVRLGKFLVPKIPDWFLPILAPILVSLANGISALAGGPSLNPILAFALGSAGVGVREIKDQVQKRIQSETETPKIAVKLFGVLFLGSILTLTSGCAGFFNPEGIKPAPVEAGQDSLVVQAERLQATSLYAYNRMINWELHNRAILPVEVSRAVDRARREFLPNWEESRKALQEYKDLRGANHENLHRLITALSVAQSSFLKLTGTGTANEISQIFQSLADLKEAVDTIRR